MASFQDIFGSKRVYYSDYRMLDGLVILSRYGRQFLGMGKEMETR